MGLVRMPLIEKFRNLARLLKASGDKEPGQDLLQLLESVPIRKTNDMSS
jgi:hypothetical protein